MPALGEAYVIVVEEEGPRAVERLPFKVWTFEVWAGICWHVESRFWLWKYGVKWVLGGYEMAGRNQGNYYEERRRLPFKLAFV